MSEKKSSSCQVIQLTAGQAEQLRQVLLESGWILSEAPYCLFKAIKEKTSAAMYRSGKLVVQGAGTNDFVEFILEPRITGVLTDPAGGTDAEMEDFFPHAGIDESGKGDFFGPLVIACAYVGTKEQAEELRKLGVRDSKEIHSDAAIAKIAEGIRRIIQGKAGMVAIGPEAYNRMYAKIGNLNRLLAWGHARALENLLDRAPECTAALADQFGSEHFIRDALMAKGRSIELRQKTKAESDIAVAAASILARAEFVRRLAQLEQQTGIKLPKGAGSSVEAAARILADRGGAEELSKVAKMHFRTSYRVLGLPEPPKKTWHAPGQSPSLF